MQSKTKSKITVLTECSIMTALATVLSIIKLAELPYGGSITVASMLPMVIIAYRHGTLVGLGTSTATAVIQMLLGISNLYYFTTWYSVVAIIFLDYIIAFSVFGLSGIFKKHIKNQAAAMLTGALLASVLRYACHVISGATLWAGLSIPTSAALIYSFGYNATYMLPDTIVLLLATLYIGGALDFTRKIPMPKAREKVSTAASVMTISAGLVAVCGLIADTVLVFAKLQNEESGDLMFTGLGDVNWLAVGIVTLSCALVAAALVLGSRVLEKQKQAQ